MKTIDNETEERENNPGGFNLTNLKISFYYILYLYNSIGNVLLFARYQPSAMRGYN